MCPKHAYTIDDPKTSDAYPPSILKAWKTFQVKIHRKRRIGWQVTSKMAEYSIEISSNNIIINNSKLYLAGEGGRAPGAGGGGGGAIGRDARGGHGGKGGNITDMDGNLVVDEDCSHVHADSITEMPPGAGGGGQGAVGIGAIGGNGGDGGDRFSGTIDIDPGDFLEMEVGAGGAAARLPGQHSFSGSDTIITVKSADGRIKRVIRSRGGAGAKSGELPDGWNPISRTDLDGGFQISTLLTANALEVRNNLVFILGGGWSRFLVPVLPWEAVWPILCVATWTQLSPTHDRAIQLCLSNPDGQEVSRLALQLPASAIEGNSFSWAPMIGAPLDREGAWRMSVQSGEFLLHEIHIGVETSQQ